MTTHIAPGLPSSRPSSARSVRRIAAGGHEAGGGAGRAGRAGLPRPPARRRSSAPDSALARSRTGGEGQDAEEQGRKRSILKSREEGRGNWDYRGLGTRGWDGAGTTGAGPAGLGLQCRGGGSDPLVQPPSCLLSRPTSSRRSSSRSSSPRVQRPGSSSVVPALWFQPPQSPRMISS